MQLNWTKHAEQTIPDYYIAIKIAYLDLFDRSWVASMPLYSDELAFYQNFEVKTSGSRYNTKYV